MKPDRNNYEIWVIDYLDGKLDPGQVMMLKNFLDENPDIREESDDLMLIRVEPTKELYKLKQGLIKDPSELSGEQFSLLCIGHLESDLTQEQEAELRQIISSDPLRSKTFDLVRKLRLKPPDAGYRYKSRLRKLTIGSKVLRLSALVVGTAAAAALLILWLRPAATDSGEMHAISKAPETQKHLSFDNSQPVTNDSAQVSGPAAVTFVNPFEDKKENRRPDSAGPAPGMAARLPVIISHAEMKDHVPLQPGLYPLLAVSQPADSEMIPPPTGAERIRVALIRFTREKILKREDGSHDEIKLYEIADAGIDGLNTLFGWQMALNQVVDDSGGLTSVNFNSKLLKFNIPVRKLD